MTQQQPGPVYGTADNESKEGECEFGQSYDKCSEYDKCEDCIKNEPSWLSKHDAAVAAKAKAEERERERALDEVLQKIDSTTDYGGNPETMFHITGLHCLIESLRTSKQEREQR